MWINALIETYKPKNKYRKAVDSHTYRKSHQEAHMTTAEKVVSILWTNGQIETYKTKNTPNAVDCRIRT